MPTAGEAAVEQVFPAVAAQKTNVDNIPSLIVDVITVNGGNYVFQGLSGATLTVEVSTDLMDWKSGSRYSASEGDTPTNPWITQLSRQLDPFNDLE